MKNAVHRARLAALTASSVPLRSADQGIRQRAAITARLLVLAVAALCAPASVWATSYADATAGALAGCVGGEGHADSGSVSALTLASFSGTGDTSTCHPLDPRVGLSLSAGGVAAANLRTGELTAYGQASGAADPNSVTQLVAGYGSATFGDTITVWGPSSSFSTTATIGLHIEGSIQGYGWVFATLGVGSAQRFRCIQTYGCSVGGATSIPPGPFSFDVTFDAPVSSSSPTLSFWAGMSANAINEGIADASSTATLSIRLPPGYSFTSGSGVLLVSEPSLLSLLATGALGFALYRGSASSLSSRSSRRSVSA